MPTYPVTAPVWVRRALLSKKEFALLDVRGESRFARGHPLFAASFPLGQLEALAAWAAADLGAGPGATGFFVLAGGTGAWERSGLPLESGEGELLSPADDVYRRPYEGTGVDPAVMRAYLEWEYGLVAQLERDGTHGFRVLVP